MRARILSAALCLGLLAAAGMVGMYTVGRTEQRKEEEELEEKMAQAEKAFEEAQQLAELARQEEARLEQERQEQERLKQELQEEEARQQASSGGAIAQFGGNGMNVPELESDFAVAEPSTTILSAEDQAALDAAAEAAALQDAEASLEEEHLETAAITYSFSPETDHLLWPIAGNIILDYSMDKTVHFATLNQYKYNPAILIQGQVDQEVLCGADGKVDRIEENDELGTVVIVDFGSGYEGVYGQLKDVTVEEGSHVQPGVKLGLVSEPTRYYAVEGPNVYFQIRKDGVPVDPMDLLE